ncbi:hypothetical protein NZD89_27235 [Alicyclobacillus fastidiosus]|uniref:Uncharacterized protein n=1 Tax=Alicyclobacillus fastidiosus TaxID=392011 RepID=A0ABY6ZG91_9BACL|nr:hypothetical protein [Alicyclobacillus fastidiosus]WAH41851.1 hypothetical protein NZD89_27235 [Alicyclobacillus fastidiosus]
MALLINAFPIIRFLRSNGETDGHLTRFDIPVMRKRRRPYHASHHPHACRHRRGVGRHRPSARLWTAKRRGEQRSAHRQRHGGIRGVAFDAAQHVVIESTACRGGVERGARERTGAKARHQTGGAW